MIRRVSIFVLLVTSVLLGSGELSNRRAPGFALPDPEYKHYYDLQDYRGKVVLIDIMNTGCPHCLLLSTTLEQVKARYGDKIMVLQVVWPPDNQSTIARYKAANKEAAQVLCDMVPITQ